MILFAETRNMGSEMDPGMGQKRDPELDPNGDQNESQKGDPKGDQNWVKNEPNSGPLFGPLLVPILVPMYQSAWYHALMTMFSFQFIVLITIFTWYA